MILRQMLAMDLKGMYGDRFQHARQGFTFVELLVVLGLSAALFVSAVPLYTKMYGQAQLSDRTQRTMQMIDVARHWSIAGREGTTYQVFFEIDPAGDDAVHIQNADQDSIRRLAFESMFEVTTNLEEHRLSFNEQGVVENFDAQNPPEIQLTHRSYGEDIITISKIGILSLLDE